MITGGCQCGALRYRAESEPSLQGLCHCRNCQRMGGGGHVGWLCFPDTAVTVEGPTLRYTTTGGSERTSSCRSFRPGLERDRRSYPPAICAGRQRRR